MYKINNQMKMYIYIFKKPKKKKKNGIMLLVRGDINTHPPFWLNKNLIILQYTSKE